MVKLLFLSVESGGNEESDPAAVCSQTSENHLHTDT